MRVQKAYNIELQQKAKEDWIEDGDQCSRVLFAGVKARRKRNTVIILRILMGVFLQIGRQLFLIS